MTLLMRYTIVFGLLLLTQSGCGTTKAPPPQAAENTPPLAVAVITAEAVRAEQSYELSGTVRARQRVVITSKLPGTVASVEVKLGDRVQAGQRLAIIDASEPNIEVARAEAAIEAARRGREQAEQGVLAAQAELRLAGATLQRIQQLFEKRSAAQQELDQAVARQQGAKAGEELARARVEEARAHERAAGLAREAAQLRLSYSEIDSPLDGFVAARNVDPGAVTAPGVPLLEIEGAGDFRLEVSIPESQVGTAKIGTQVHVELPSIGLRGTGRVIEVAPMAEPASRSSLIRIQLPAHPGLRSGLFGRATFAAEQREMLSLPDNVIHRQGQLTSIFIFDQGIARRRLVSLGRQTDGRTEILSGLQTGEQVIASQTAALNDGSAVEIAR